MAQFQIGAKEAIDFIKELAKTLKENANRTAEVILQNKTNYPLVLWDKYVSSGTWAKGRGAVDPEDIKPGDVEIAGAESNGAGAVGTIVYQVGETSVYAAIFFESPWAGTSVVQVRLLYQPGWADLTSDRKEEIMDELDESLDGEPNNTAPQVKGMNLSLKASMSGNKDIEVKYVLEYEKSDMQTVMFTYDNKPWCPLYDETYYMSDADPNLKVSGESDGGVLPFFNHHIPGPEHTIWDFKLAGYGEQYYLNRDDETLILTKEKATWRVRSQPNDLYAVQTKTLGRYIKVVDDDDDALEVIGKDETAKASQFKLTRIDIPESP